MTFKVGANVQNVTTADVEKATGEALSTHMYTHTHVRTHTRTQTYTHSRGRERRTVPTGSNPKEGHSFRGKLVCSDGDEGAVAGQCGCPWAPSGISPFGEGWAALMCGTVSDRRQDTQGCK